VGCTFGVNDQAGGTAGGGVQTSSSVAIDSTRGLHAVHVNLADGLAHTMSEYVTAVSGLGTGNKPLQIGFLSPTSTGFNTGFSFISARILGNNSVRIPVRQRRRRRLDQQHHTDGTINTGDCSN